MQLVYERSSHFWARKLSCKVEVPGMHLKQLHKAHYFKDQINLKIWGHIPHPPIAPI